MVCAVGTFTLRPMANTNHKLPRHRQLLFPCDSIRSVHIIIQTSHAVLIFLYHFPLCYSSRRQGYFFLFASRILLEEGEEACLGTML